MLKVAKLNDEDVKRAINLIFDLEKQGIDQFHLYAAVRYVAEALEETKGLAMKPPVEIVQ